MKTVSIPYPEGLPQSLKLSDSEFAGEIRFLAAGKLYVRQDILQVRLQKWPIWTGCLFSKNLAVTRCRQ
jgi:hypothetical protein